MNLIETYTGFVKIIQKRGQFQNIYVVTDFATVKTKALSITMANDYVIILVWVFDNQKNEHHSARQVELSLKVGSYQIVGQIEHEYSDQHLGQKQISFLGLPGLGRFGHVQEQIASVGPHQLFAVEFVPVDQVFVRVQQRVVDVGFALVAPDRKVAETEG